jgi:hypothetical protein
MNLKLTNEVIAAGGLHELILNLPPNIRVEQKLEDHFCTARRQEFKEEDSQASVGNR